FFVGQGFSDHYERAVALAEKTIRSLVGRVPLSILRSGPVVGGEDDASVLSGALLDHVVATLNSEGNERGVVLSDAHVRLDTAGRVADALLRLTPAVELKVAHLVDRKAMTVRGILDLVADKMRATLHDNVGGTGAKKSGRGGTIGGSKALWGWPVEITRTVAEYQLSELLDRDEAAATTAILGDRF